MDSRTFFIAVIAALAGCVGGFLLANTLNRSEVLELRAQVDKSKTETTVGSERDAKSSLTDEEIAGMIQRADQNAGDLQIQRTHGVSLYRYGAIKQDASLIQQSVKILERAIALKSDDYDVILSLGNAYFDVGYFGKDNASLAKARLMYDKALAIKPNDVEVQTDIALTYFLETPPDLGRAVEEFRKSLEKNPKHEKTLQFIVQALIKQNNSADAAKYLEQLRAVNPRNETIAESTSMLSNIQPAG